MEPTVKVAQYVRMSTDHQRYSTFNQRAVIAAYARRRGMEIVQTYADEGKSGLDLAGRQALKRMLADVMTDAADYVAILVYDVSRWGRFQDTDESAYYEFICRQAGIRVHYCAEEFENDGSISATILKTLKRAMAGEYSRELSAKVFAGQCHLITLGYRPGASAGYGLRRQVISEDGSFKACLARGERKSLATDRVILVPGSPREVATVRRIYHLFVNEGKSMNAIVDLLNAKGARTHTGRKWTRDIIKAILTNEKYIGNNVYNRTSTKLKQKVVRNPPDLWVRAERVFEPIVDKDLFDRAREIFDGRVRFLSDCVLLERLSKLLAINGSLSRDVINNAPDVPSAASYRARFGSMKAAYDLIGYDAGRDNRHVDTKRMEAGIRDDVATAACREMNLPASWRITKGTAAIISVGAITVRVRVVLCNVSAIGTLRWRVAITARFKEDLLLVIRLERGGNQIRDYCILPMANLRGFKNLNLEPTHDRLGCRCFSDISDVFDYLKCVSATR